MIRFRLSTPLGDVFVSLAASEAQSSADVAYSGEPEAVEIVREWLPSTLDATGHIIGDETTPVDLYVAMRSEYGQLLGARLVEGSGILKAADIPIGRPRKKR